MRDEFIRRFPPSFQIVAMSLFISVVFGISLRHPLGDVPQPIAGLRRAHLRRAASSIPEFFLLTLLIIIPSYLWSYSQPVGGYVPIYEDPWTNLRLILPPAIIIGIAGSAGLMRLTRTTMLEVLRSDYVRTAQAKGLRQRPSS